MSQAGDPSPTLSVMSASFEITCTCKYLVRNACEHSFENRNRPCRHVGKGRHEVVITSRTGRAGLWKSKRQVITGELLKLLVKCVAKLLCTHQRSEGIEL